MYDPNDYFESFTTRKSADTSEMPSSLDQKTNIAITGIFTLYILSYSCTMQCI